MEEKKQRRNKRILIISAMLVLLIALLCFGGTTFAKYITSKDAPVQQATVAKWGFAVTVDTDNMFSDKYNAGAIVKATTDAPNPTVDVKADNKVVAPGTKGSMTITINGVAEVDAKIVIAEKLKANTTTDEKNTPAKDITIKTTGDSAKTYNPIKWKVSVSGTIDGANATINAATGSDLQACLTALATDKAISAGKEVANLVYKLEWEWAFDKQDDALDTVLGRISAKAQGGTDAKVVQDTTTDTTWTVDDVRYTDVCTEIAFELTVSVVQTTNKTETPAA